MCFLLLKLPIEFEISPLASLETASVNTLILAPKAPEPLVDVPTPRCNCKLSTDEEKSPKLTQNVPKDSASLYGIPLIVTFVDCELTPLTLMPV